MRCLVLDSAAPIVGVMAGDANLSQRALQLMFRPLLFAPATLIFAGAAVASPIHLTCLIVSSKGREVVYEITINSKEHLDNQIPDAFKTISSVLKDHQ